MRRATKCVTCPARCAADRGRTPAGDRRAARARAAVTPPPTATEEILTVSRETPARILSLFPGKHPTRIGLRWLRGHLDEQAAPVVMLGPPLVHDAAETTPAAAGVMHPGAEAPAVIEAAQTCLSHGISGRPDQFAAADAGACEQSMGAVISRVLNGSMWIRCSSEQFAIFG